MPAALTCDRVVELAAGFVLGALDPAETAAVRDHLATCPGSHAEFGELGGAVPYLAETVDPIEAPAELWSRIRAAAAADLRAGQRDELAADRLISALGRPPAPRPVAPTAPERGAEPVEPAVASVGPTPLARPAEPAPSAPRAPDVPVRRRSMAGLPARAWALAAAAVLAIVVLGVGNVLLQRDLAAAREYGARLDRALALAASPGSRSAVLGPGQAGGPAGGLAVVPAAGTGIVVVHDLAPTTETQVYEVWVTVGKTAPVPAGSFRVGADGRGWLEGLAAPGGTAPNTSLVIALTREPGPGATAPSSPVVAMGTATPTVP